MEVATTLALDNTGPVETLEHSRVSAVAGRAEIDRSAPFVSVKEAVDRFGGSAQWKSQLRQLFQPEKHQTPAAVDVMLVEKQAAQLQKDLVVKEKETLEILRELEVTKKNVDNLKLKLQKEKSNIPEKNSDSMKVHPIPEAEEYPPSNLKDQLDIGSKQSPGLILLELKQAKVNLNRTTTDLAGIRASVELLSSKIEKEKALLDKTCEKLSSNTALVSSLDEELNQTTRKLQETKEERNPSNISEETRKLTSEIEQLRQMKETSNSEVLKLTAEIEQTNASIKTAEIRWFAAKKMEEAAKAAEAVAIAEIKALTNKALTNNNNIPTEELETPSLVTLSFEEYTELTRKAREADEISRKKIEAAMGEVEEANQRKLQFLTEVEIATAEVKASKKAFEEALLRVEAANRGKLAVEEALRKWRSEQGRRRQFVHNSPKFKKSNQTHHRRDSRMLDLNGLSLVTDVPRIGIRPTLSIGQILSRKLMSPKDYDVGINEKINVKTQVSLGQMLSKKHGALSPLRVADDGPARKQYSVKRNKFGLVGLSLLKAKQSKKARKNRRKGKPEA